MSLIVQHNMSAMNANRMLGITTNAQSKSTEKLSSGYRINRAADDAAGLAISEKMRAQIRGLDQASSNAQDGISLIQTAEGALTETHSILQRMRELAVQAANDTATDDDRTQIQNEIDQLTQEVDRIANTTEFNTKKLLDGSRTGSVSEKAGKVSVESSFTNSMVSASVTTDGSAKSSFTDVIRLEIVSDFTDGQSTAGTKKLSDEDITKLNSLLTTNTSVTLGKVGQAGTAVSLANTTYASTNSTAENAESALSALKTSLTTAQTSLNTAATDVETNAEAVDKTVEDIMKLADATKAKDGTTILKDGVTEDDVKEALTAYINALVTDGVAGGAGTATEITEAKTKLDNLFNTGLADTVVVETASAASAYTITEATKNGSNAEGVAAVKNTEYTTSTKVSAVVTAATTALDAFAKSVAGTEITASLAKETVDILEDWKTTLSDTELCEAVVDYKNAVKEYDDNKTGATDDKKAELQAKVDSAKAALDELNTAKNVLTVTDLFGNSDTDSFAIAEKVDDDNNLTVTITNKSGDDTVITIANANLLKAGDTLTITSEAMVETKEAATGKDALRLQIGANAGQEMSLGINSMKANALDIVQTKEGNEGEALDVTNQASASMAINAYDMAIQKVSTERAKMGAVQNRLEHTISNLDTASENTQTAESRIRDTDMAEEMVEYSKNNILAQAGQSMLAQANQSTQGVLSLLQ